MTNAIDLSRLPEYDPIEQKNIDQIIAENVTYLEGLGFQVGNGAEDPAYRQVLALSYRELLWRKEQNQAHKNQILAYARGAALDHIGVTYHRVQRLDNEECEDYLARIVAAPEGYTNAGSEQAYLFFARSADANVQDVSFHSPEPLLVSLTVLTKDKSVASSELLNIVEDAVNPEDVRAQGDIVTTQAAELLTYEINAVLRIPDNSPDKGVVVDAVRTALQEYCDKEYRLEGYVNEGRIYANAYQEGVLDVELSGWSDIQATKFQAPLCTNINLTVT